MVFFRELSTSSTHVRSPPHNPALPTQFLPSPSALPLGEELARQIVASSLLTWFTNSSSESHKAQMPHADPYKKHLCTNISGDCLQFTVQARVSLFKSKAPLICLGLAPRGSRIKDFSISPLNVLAFKPSSFSITVSNSNHSTHCPHPPCMWEGRHHGHDPFV